MNPAPHASVAFQSEVQLGEGPLWDPAARVLYFVDILGKKVHAFDPASGTARAFPTPGMVTAAAPRAAGGLILALDSGIASFNPATGEVRFLMAPHGHDSAQLRFNDGKCDPQGRFWAGTMSYQARPGAGALYCFSAGRAPRRAIDGVSISNGLAWSRDGATLYYIDSPTRRVDAFAFDGGTGELSNRRTVISLPPGKDLPDGCTLDAEGMLWVAHWAGSKVSRWDPSTGKLLLEISLPAPLVTSCAFGGPDLDVLFITTARCELSPEELASFPLSGSVFSCRPGVRGFPPVAFAG